MDIFLFFQIITLVLLVLVTSVRNIFLQGVTFFSVCLTLYLSIQHFQTIMHIVPILWLINAIINALTFERELKIWRRDNE